MRPSLWNAQPSFWNTRPSIWNTRLRFWNTRSSFWGFKRKLKALPRVYVTRRSMLFQSAMVVRLLTNVILSARLIVVWLFFCIIWRMRIRNTFMSRSKQFINDSRFPRIKEYTLADLVLKKSHYHLFLETFYLGVVVIRR